VGLWVTNDEVIVRNFFWTHRLARREVTAVSAVAYDGFLNWGMPSRLGLTSLKVTTSRAEVVAYGLITGPRRARAAASRVQATLALLPGAAARP
jgi:hypothetical protein